MAIDLDMTLAQVVDAHPPLARELERRGLDYCCGGGRTLAEACAWHELDPGLTIVELAAAVNDSVAAEWTTMTATELVDYLEATHHHYLRDELPRIAKLMDKIVAVHGERHPELAYTASVFAHLCADLEPHMLKEERVLFPMIRELESSTLMPSFHCGSLGNPISVMLFEHDAVGGLLSELRRLTGGYQSPADGCASYVACLAALAELEANTHMHIHKENNVLFPMVLHMESARNAALQS
ncbi:MAG: iron-sulfur cluster repair di-iron protein [Actinobacteria bacterium]|nr:iron-sulfur cluster repair di-iron protein [Actinomycetota bacterium]